MAVHALHCKAVCTSLLESCSTATGDCALLLAQVALLANYISKLLVSFKRDLGICSDRSDNLLRT